MATTSIAFPNESTASLKRSPDSIAADDTNYQDTTVTAVTTYDAASHVCVVHFDSRTWSFNSPDYTPQVGDHVRVYMSTHPTDAIRGLLVNDRVIFYQTQAEFDSSEWELQKVLDDWRTALPLSWQQEK